jgi:hypothetical protein
MASQEQKIENSSIKDSPIQQVWARRDAVSFQNSHGNQVTIKNIVVRLFDKPEPPQVDWDWAQKILNEQLAKIHQRLVDTLDHDRTLMDIPAEEQPSWVNRPLQAKRTLRVNSQDCGPLDANKLLIETFGRNDVAGKLLILGASGSGKTTALLSLAEQLLNGALAQPQKVIPVLFELSTWHDDNLSIHKWLVEQLYDLYGGEPRYRRYESWLEQRVLLPLLDGLDELGLERQKKCISELKEFAKHYPSIVVCCRDKAFDAADIELDPLRSAVCLQSLSNEQIEAYLKSKNRSELWSAIQAQPDLSKLLEPTTEGDPGLFRVPLFLKLAADVYDPQKPILNKSDLLEKYIEKQLCPKMRKQYRRQYLEKRKWAYKTVEEEPDWRQVRKTLSWVALHLNNNHSVELMIEKMQPSWLTNGEPKQYRITIALIIALIIVVIVQILQLLEINPANGIKLEIRLILGLCLGLVIALISLPISWRFMRKTKDIKPIESVHARNEEQIRQAICGSFFATTVGTLFVLTIAQIIERFIAPIPSVKLFVLIVAPIIGLIVFSIAALKAELELKDRSTPNQGIKNSCKNMLLLTIINMVVVIPYAMYLEVHLPVIFKGSLIPGFLAKVLLICSIGFCLLAGGGWALIQHSALRIVLKMNGYIPYRFDKFLNYCDERKLLYPIGGRYRFLHRELLDHFDPSKR